ncbi:hypothetical protein M409DRAFT_57354 [Zasmidium cellare ATCC 36951]|uniref:Heterokaryon incompatibility domain-containing protein n=1 Tax=Zasmidium cellare ATCC 36951 TaxID=1080233 RepID=A0A6A6C8D4_ZASCE|nr:uncharacterized protein M409DRAFT_57354 [Zasmidium cellare ATCC 36951]KAF2163447.1 hypothetical protein M409DRAFT_57354 [Zasmidium cellare ATCC 36951]
MGTMLRYIPRVLLKYLAQCALGGFLAFGFVQYHTWIVLGWTFESVWTIYRTLLSCVAWLGGWRAAILLPTKGSNRCGTCKAEFLQCNKSFQYPALVDGADSIRLLRIIEDQQRDIKCQLATFSLDEAPDYLALSYRWTADDPKHMLTLNESTFHVRGNLHDFLKTMKHEGNPSWLFIDAICINQHDVRERSHQVALMRQIYTSATEVVAWLRCESKRPTIDGEEMTIRSSPAEMRKALKKMTDDLDDDPELKHLPAGAIAMMKESMEKYARERYAERFKAVQETTVWHIFLEDDYWTRLWPVQEILLARNLTFRCRKVAFDWVDLQIVVEEQRPEIHGLYDKAQLPPHRAYQPARDNGPLKMGAHKLTMMSELLWRKHHQQRLVGHFNTCIPLYEAIIQFAGQKCTDPRDKIFGLVGICQAKLKPYYDMPLSEVYLRALVEGLVEIFEEHSAEPDNISSAASLKKITTFCWALRYALGLDEMSATVSLITKEVLHLFSPPQSMICDDLSWTGLPLNGIVIRNIQPLLTNDVLAFAWTHFSLDKIYYDMSRTFFEGRYPWMGKFKEWANNGGWIRARLLAVFAEMIFGPLYLASRWPLMVYHTYDSLMTLPGGEEVRKYGEWSKMSGRVFQDMMKDGIVPRKFYILTVLEDNEERIVDALGGLLAKGMAFFAGQGEDEGHQTTGNNST